MKFLAKGAEASIYLTVHDGKPAVLKRRAPKPYRVPELDKKIRRERTRREARTMAAVKRLGVSAPLVYCADEGKAEIVMQKIEGRLLKDVPTAGMAAFGECGRELALMHGQGVVHGDFTSANVMVEKGGGIVFIDFGLASFSQSVEEQATDLVVFAKSVGAGQYAAFEKGYCKASGAKAKAILRQVDQIERRGRYAVR
ncbi:MAG: KEOPS complex kinase/ATPase Bud32, partial [Candidatus Micrarchaeota archaeon]